MLRRTLECFEAQTYSQKELVLVHDLPFCEESQALIDQAQSDARRLRRNPLQVIFVKDLPALGALRNIGVSRAKGEYVAQFDDDDWHAPTRIEVQVKKLIPYRKKIKGCVLLRWMVYDETLKIGYLGERRLWEGSLLCERETLIKTPYAEISKYEDTPVLEELHALGVLIGIEDQPNLYCYCYHGKNTWDRSHWLKLFDRCQRLPHPASHELGVLIGREEPQPDDDEDIDARVTPVPGGGWGDGPAIQRAKDLKR